MVKIPKATTSTETSIHRVSSLPPLAGEAHLLLTSTSTKKALSNSAFLIAIFMRLQRDFFLPFRYSIGE